jgi:hypothetical protein
MIHDGLNFVIGRGLNTNNKYIVHTYVIEKNEFFSH